MWQLGQGFAGEQAALLGYTRGSLKLLVMATCSPLVQRF
jgi:hypothetical protein